MKAACRRNYIDPVYVTTEVFNTEPLTIVLLNCYGSILGYCHGYSIEWFPFEVRGALNAVSTWILP